VTRGSSDRSQGVPVDPALPALGAMHSDGRDATLRALGLPPPFDGVAVLKHHEGSRCTFVLRAAGRLLVAKAFRRPGVVEAQTALGRALERHGLASGTPPTAPRIVAADPELRIFVTEHVDGPSSTTLLARGTRAGLIASDWLRRQWAAPIRLGPPYGVEDFLARVERNQLRIAGASAALGVRAAEVVATLAEDLPDGTGPVLVHGSFSASHVVDLGAGAGVIDWDGFAQGPREIDAAAFLATAARVATGRPTLAGPVASAVAAFRGAIAADVDPRALAWYEAGARLRNARHVCVHRPPDWEARAERLLTPAPAPVRAPAEVRTG
jgi:aminoglycoside phosphotransferase (APT) family kinase protein